MNQFSHLPDSSRVWLFQSDKPITNAIRQALLVDLNSFMNEWAAHGDKLFGAGDVLEDYFVAIVIDESKVPASGCSIDTLTNFIKQLGVNNQLDFFNRMNILIEDHDEKKVVHFSELPKYENAHLFNPLVSQLGELRTNWKISVKDSSFV